MQVLLIGSEFKPHKTPSKCENIYQSLHSRKMDELHKRLLHPWTLKKKDLVGPLKKKDHVRLNSVPMENRREAIMATWGSFFRPIN